jgi:hypothetical protein
LTQRQRHPSRETASYSGSRPKHERANQQANYTLKQQARHDPATNQTTNNATGTVTPKTLKRCYFFLLTATRSVKGAKTCSNCTTRSKRDTKRGQRGQKVALATPAPKQWGSSQAAVCTLRIVTPSKHLAAAQRQLSTSTATVYLGAGQQQCCSSMMKIYQQSVSSFEQSSLQQSSL